LIKSVNRKKKTCFLNPKNMQQHMGYFLQTFGMLPQGNLTMIIKNWPKIYSQNLKVQASGG